MQHGGKLESFSKNLEKEGSGAMYSVAAPAQLDRRSPKEVIRSVGQLLAPGAPATSYFHKIRRELEKRLPVDFRVTERRVRAIHDGDARRVDWQEMQALLEIEALEEAKRARTRNVARAIRLAALIRSEDEVQDSCRDLRNRGCGRRMDRAGIEAGR